LQENIKKEEHGLARWGQISICERERQPTREAPEPPVTQIYRTAEVLGRRAKTEEIRATSAGKQAMGLVDLQLIWGATGSVSLGESIKESTIFRAKKAPAAKERPD